MAHSVLAVNPFDVLLRLHMQQAAVDSNFQTWLRCFREPPIRTTRALIEHCPRVDWLFWYLEQTVHLGMLPADVLLVVGPTVRRYLELILQGHTFSRDRNVNNMPHTEGLTILREILHRTLFE